MANILGINLSELNREAALAKADEFLNSDTNHYLVTPNPEIILAAHKDEEFFHILNQADLSLADGMGLKIAGLLMHERIYRLTGADFTLDLLDLAAKKNYKTLILNWSQGLSSPEDISSALKNKYPNLDFLVLNIAKEILLTDEVIEKINNYAPKLVFNTLGFPYQEKLMFFNLAKLPSVRLMLGIGGSFDFISGKIKRAPLSLRYLGLEWFWRLIGARHYKDSSKRVKRIYNATFVFMKKVFRARFINPFLFRSNVACFMYKKEGGKIKVLLVERTDQKGHWQLPQGGTDGEDLETAGRRELEEETGAKNLITKAIFPKLSKYYFPKKNLNKNYKTFKYDYKGQIQGLYIGEFKGQDSEIKINFWDHRAWQWVDLANVLNVLDSFRQPAFKNFYEKIKTLDL
ncbi:MAG: WecB/TagA/CpsF family glycosyltransferase [Patescibacteria group bacterium]